jgi:hypothetical protein
MLLFCTSLNRETLYINVAPLGLFAMISWGDAPGYINVAPLGLFGIILVSQKVQFVPFLNIFFSVLFHS